jgi:CheY-like chemotaxis protein
MMLSFAGYEIAKVAVVDDQSLVRDSLAHLLIDMQLTPVLQSGPLVALEETARHLSTTSHAVLCDLKLQMANYANFDGSQLVARLYELKIPAVLCTRYEISSMDLIRGRRASIPCLVAPGELSESTLARGFEVCVQEFDDKFQPSRRPWRTLVRVVDVDPHHIHFCIPAWNADEKVRLLREDVPVSVGQRAKTGARFHARVNIGADLRDDIYFTDWETQ